MKKELFTKKEDWNDSHATIWVSGATAKQIIRLAKEYDDDGEYFFNGTVEDNGLISFDLTTSDHRSICDEFSEQIEDAVFYSFSAWDEHDLYASQNGSQYTKYAIRTDEAPYIDDPSPLGDFEKEDFCELQFENIFAWDFTVLDENGKDLFSVGAGDFALQEIDNIWNKQ